MVEPEEAEIVVEQDAPFSTPRRSGSGRVEKPSSKVRDSKRNEKNDSKRDANGIDQRGDRPNERSSNSSNEVGRAT